MLRKRDELQFPKLYAHIRLRREQGLLIFLSCKTQEVEKYLKDKIKTEFSGQFPIKEIPISARGYIPLQYIAGSGEFSPEILYIIGEFPYEEYYKDPEAMEDQLYRLTTALNIGRELFSSRDLKCVFICPPEIEDRIALKAADFYHFTHYSASFTDDAKFHRDIERMERGGQEKQKRIDFLLEILKETRKKEDKAGIYLDLGQLYYELSENNTALLYWQKALNIYKKSKDKKKHAAALGNIGMVYFIMGQLQEALKYHQQALKIFRKVGYFLGEANQLGNIGLVYRALGKPEEALKSHKQSLEIHKEVRYHQGEAANLDYIGLVYREIGQLEEALKYHQQALEIYRKFGYLKGKPIVLGNIGTMYRELGQPEEALKYLKQSLETNRKVGYLQGEASDLGNIGLVYSDLGQPQEALKYLKESQQIYRQINIPIPESFTSAINKLSSHEEKKDKK